MRSVNLPFLRQVVEALLRRLRVEEGLDLGIYILAKPEMTRLNEKFLRHAGPTDVLTFDYHDAAKQQPWRSGEIFVCIDEAIAQSRRFRAHWPAELVRYIIHGLLHLEGYDDLKAGPRREMKRAEDQLLRHLARQFDLKELAIRQGRKRNASAGPSRRGTPPLGGRVRTIAETS